jgi:hypothetical protein
LVPASGSVLKGDLNLASRELDESDPQVGRTLSELVEGGAVWLEDDHLVHRTVTDKLPRRIDLRKDADPDRLYAFALDFQTGDGLKDLLDASRGCQ